MTAQIAQAGQRVDVDIGKHGTGLFLDRHDRFEQGQRGHAQLVHRHGQQALASHRCARLIKDPSGMAQEALFDQLVRLIHGE